MASICYSAGGIGGFDDSRSVSSLTTVSASNRSKVAPEISRMAEVPHNEDEKDYETIDTDPSHEVAGSHHPSIFGTGSVSDITTSDSQHLDPDLQAEVNQAIQAAMQAAINKAKVEQRKRTRKRKRALQAEHEDEKKQTKKRRDDDEDDEDGNEGDGKPPAAAAPAAPAAVSAK